MPKKNNGVSPYTFDKTSDFVENVGLTPMSFPNQALEAICTFIRLRIGNTVMILL